MNASYADCVLYKNAGGNVYLLDIPRSLEETQCSSKTLKSAPPVNTPCPSTEPKGKKRTALLQTIPTDELEYHYGIQMQCELALREIGSSKVDMPWLLPRMVHSGASLKHNEVHYNATASTDELHLGPPLGGSFMTWTGPPVILSAVENAFDDISQICETAVHNPWGIPTSMSLKSELFTIPPRSTFISATIEKGMSVFAQALKTFNLESRFNSPFEAFEIILLDPPWSNRSARRSQQYKLSADQAVDPFDQTLPIIRDYLTQDGIVCVWITNKAAVMKQVLQSLGQLGLHLIAEWIWLKVTTTGAPVYALDGIWRRPYEILLLFNKGEPTTQIARQIIVAVPDVHSRKPCLKKLLLEAYSGQQPRVLEMFARNLVAGWWSWGDEVLKFQHHQHWSEEEATEER